MIKLVLGGAVVAALTYIVTRALVRRKIIGKIDFMSDALDSGESAFRYSEDQWSDRRLNKSLNRLRAIFEAEKTDIRERERYFGIMLDHVQSGVIVIDGDKIDYSNIIVRRSLQCRQPFCRSPEAGDPGQLRKAACHAQADRGSGNCNSRGEG